MLEVPYHHAKFGGARISPAAGAANNAPSCCCIIISFCFSMSVSPANWSSSGSVRSSSAESGHWNGVEDEPDAGGSATCALSRRMCSVASGRCGRMP